jgi:peptide/nickel transport system permease protein
MIRAIALRLVSALATLLGALALLFALTLLVPGNPAQVLLGPRATPAAIAAYSRMMGLDLPLPERFATFIWRALHGDLGVDVVSGRRVIDLVLEVLPDTLALTAAAMVLAIVAGVALALLAVRRPGAALDQITALLSLSFMAMPNFVVAVLLLLLFSATLGWAPVLGGGGVAGLVLPAVTLALGWVGYVARLLRASLLEVLAAPYIRTARAYGISERRILLRHALPPALVPLVAVLGVGVGQLLGGAIFIELIFGRPGIGSLVVHAIGDRDYPVVQTGVLVVVALFVATNLLVDLLLLRLDPRMRG